VFPLCEMQLQGIRERMKEKTNGGVKVHLVFDALRGSRGQPSSRSMLTPLVKDFPDNVKVSLYHTNLLGGLVKRMMPDRFNEAFGLFHMKIYVFDDDVILTGFVCQTSLKVFHPLELMIPSLYLFVSVSVSVCRSANLSDSYFVDRQDRYVLFKNNSSLANYFSRLAGVVGEVSYDVTASNELQGGAADFVDPVVDGEKFKAMAR